MVELITKEMKWHEAIDLSRAINEENGECIARPESTEIVNKLDRGGRIPARGFVRLIPRENISSPHHLQQNPK